jgi:molybdate transport system substrate-binding protein
MRSRVALLLVAGLGLVAVPARAETTLRVFAAASLNESFTEIARGFEAEHPGVRVELQLAGTQVLRTQIEQGAAADVFASADLVHAEALTSAGLLRDMRLFARNVLVVVVPHGRPRVRQLADLARPGTKLVVAGPSVPVGRYTSQALGRMDGSGRYGADFQSRVMANVVSQESNVRAVLAKVSLGEADAGVVYATDAATAAGRVEVLGIPEDVNVVADFPIGLVQGSGQAALARAFVEAVLGPSGQDVLVRRGFRKP